MTQPTLKTERLTLAYPIVHSGMNLSHYLNWLCNDGVTKFSEQRHLKHTPDTQYEYISSFAKSEHCFWEIQRHSTPIGSITAYRDIPNRTANLGIMIGETRMWGQGYGHEAWDGVCKFLFDGGTRKIEASCMAANLGMIHVLEKAGFRFEAAIHNHFLLNGKPEDKVCYGKYREAEVIQLKKEDTEYRR